MKYDGKDASVCAIKASAVNCAVLPCNRQKRRRVYEEEESMVKWLKKAGSPTQSNEVHGIDRELEESRQKNRKKESSHGTESTGIQP